jgi:hypothetical protein
MVAELPVLLDAVSVGRFDSLPFLSKLKEMLIEVIVG